jgi:hypothetical protein
LMTQQQQVVLAEYTSRYSKHFVDKQGAVRRKLAQSPGAH